MLSFTISQSLLKFISIDLVMLSNHLTISSSAALFFCLLPQPNRRLAALAPLRWPAEGRCCWTGSLWARGAEHSCGLPAPPWRRGSSHAEGSPAPSWSPDWLVSLSLQLSVIIICRGCDTKVLQGPHLWGFWFNWPEEETQYQETSMCRLVLRPVQKKMA